MGKINRQKKTRIVVRAQRTTGTEARGKVAAALATPGKALVGFLIWWSLRDCRIERTRLTAELDALGAKGCIPERPGPMTLLRRSEGHAMVGRPHLAFEQVHKDAGKATHAVLLRSIDEGQRKAEYATAARLVLDRKTEALTLETAGAGQPGHAEAEAVLREYEDMRDFARTQDVSDTVVKLMEHVQAVPMRASGGVFFVDARQAATVEGIGKLVNSLGGSIWSCFRVTDPEERAQVATATRSALAGKLEVLRAEMAEFTEGKEKLQERSVRMRVERFRALRAQVAYYAELLGDTQAELLAGIDAAQVALEASLGLADDDAQPALPGTEEDEIPAQVQRAAE